MWGRFCGYGSLPAIDIISPVTTTRSLKRNSRPSVDCLLRTSRRWGRCKSDWQRGSWNWKMMTPCPARGAALRQKTCLLVLIAAGSALSAAGQRREGSAWVGTWASAPMAGETSPALAAQTLRQIVRTCVAGSEVRIRVSNLFGAQPLRIEDVHLAIASTGGAIVAGTDHAV